MTKNQKIAVGVVVVAALLYWLKKRLAQLRTLKSLPGDNIPYGPPPADDNLTDPDVSGPRQPDGSLYTQ